MNNSEVEQSPEQKQFSLHDAEVGEVLSIFSGPRLRGLTALKDGTIFDYHVNQGDSDAKMTVKANSDEGLTVQFSRAPELGDVLIPWQEADLLMVFPVKQ